MRDESPASQGGGPTSLGSMRWKITSRQNVSPTVLPPSGTQSAGDIGGTSKPRRNAAGWASLDLS